MRFAHYPLTYRSTLSRSIRHSQKNELSTAEFRNITVIGGGLAGLAVTYHLLNQSTFTRIRILDQAGVGEAGASSVAGGLLHPLSPRGKIVYRGLEGIKETNVLLEAALTEDENIVLRDQLYRVATSEKNAVAFQKTAQDIPHICEWVSQADMQIICNSNDVHGGLLLKNGCKVIDVPSYLRGLWKACESVAQDNKCSLSWTQINGTANDWLKDNGKEDETVVYAAGSGLFDSNLLGEYASCFPVQLVHGQSLELRYEDSNSNKVNDALLCGKYVSPLSDPAFVLVGSTHEFKETLMPQDEVIRELRDRTFGVAPNVWQQCAVHKVTRGTRVQTERGKNGRLPIIGQLPASNHWVFTGLSSRGLLYHAMYGKILANAILNESEDHLTNSDGDILWWKSKFRPSTL